MIATPATCPATAKHGEPVQWGFESYDANNWGDCYTARIHGVRLLVQENGAGGWDFHRSTGDGNDLLDSGRGYTTADDAREAATAATCWGHH